MGLISPTTQQSATMLGRMLLAVVWARCQSCVRGDPAEILSPRSQVGAVGSKRKLTPAGAITGNTTPQGLPAGQPPGRVRAPLPKPGRKAVPQQDPWLR